MIYLIHQMGFSEAYLNDPMWETTDDALPDGSAILVRESAKALEGDDFEYYPEGSGDPVRLSGVDPAVFAYYFKIHRYHRKFGLPHDRGWINELPWVPDFLAYMDDVRLEIENWRIREAGRRTGDVDIGE